MSELGPVERSPLWRRAPMGYGRGRQWLGTDEQLAAEETRLIAEALARNDALDKRVAAAIRDGENCDPYRDTLEAMYAMQADTELAFVQSTLRLRREAAEERERRAIYLEQTLGPDPALARR